MCDGLLNWFYQLKRKSRTFPCVHCRYLLYQTYNIKTAFSKRPCVYMLLLYDVLRIKQAVMVQQIIYSLKTDTFEYQKP